MKLYLLGFMGAGKTTIGKLLAKELEMIFVDLDELIEKREELTIPDIFSKFGQQHFREKEKQALHSTFKLENSIISTGGGVPCFFDNIEQINSNGQSIFLNFNSEVLASRIKADKKNERPLAAAKTNEELIKFVKNKLHERKPFYNKAKIIIEGSALSPTEIVKRIINELNI